MVSLCAIYVLITRVQERSAINVAKCKLNKYSNDFFINNNYSYLEEVNNANDIIEEIKNDKKCSIT